MGLRCLIGHDFGEPQIERDRDEQGDEVVVTIREFKECARCGERQTVSENKEVTSLAAPEPDPEPEPEPSSTEYTSPAGSTPSGESLENVSAAEDDGIILDDDSSGEPTRGHGEWPAADMPDDDSAPSITTNGEVDVEAADEVGSDADGDVDGDDGHDPAPAESGDQDAATEETGDAPSSGVETEHAWPEVDEGADEGFDAGTSDGEVPSDAFTDEYSTTTKAATPDSAEVLETTPGGSGTGFISDQPGPTPGHQQRETPGVKTEFVCPSCDHRLDSTGSSLRPGDICPECGKGYLAERESGASRNK